MKVVILAGGRGTRIREVSNDKPKPMVEIDDRPIIWHIMASYARFGLKDFIVCLGYKGYMIADYFQNYRVRNSDLIVDLGSEKVSFVNPCEEDWKITLVQTGLNTMTGGRIKRVAKYLDDDDFCLTYGDAVSDVDIPSLIEQHNSSGSKASVTAVRPNGRFGLLSLGSNNRVSSFMEKPEAEDGWINGGFFVLKQSVIDYIDGDQTIWERDPLERLAAENELSVYLHNNFWQCMDTYRDWELLNKMCEDQHRPWLG